MPKKVKSDSEWRERLKEYANNNFKFGQGQKPPPNSKWTKVINQIDRCPLKNSRKDALGRDLTCLCNYHVKEVCYYDVVINSVPVINFVISFISDSEWQLSFRESESSRDLCNGTSINCE